LEYAYRVSSLISEFAFGKRYGEIGSARDEKCLRKNLDFKGSKTYKVRKLGFLGILILLRQMLKNHIKLRTVIMMCEYCYNLYRTKFSERE